jgi:hypothetical protein
MSQLRVDLLALLPLWALSRLLYGVPILIGALSATPTGMENRPGFPLVADAFWYASIGATGYHAEPLVGGLHDVAFWPLWGLFERLLAGGSTNLDALGWAGTIAAPLLLLAAGVVYRGLFRERGREDLGALLPLVLFFGPAGYVGSLAYSEPLFLLLSGIALRSASTSGLIAGLIAGLTRPTGALLAAAALLRRDLRLPRRLLLAGAPLVGLGSYLLVAALVTGRPDPWALTGGGSWLETTGQAKGIIGWFIEFLPDPLMLVATAWWWLPIGIATAGLLVIVRDERLHDLAALCALTIGVILITGLWSSAPRMALAALPALVAGWSLLPPRPRRLLIAMTTSGGAAAGGIAAADLIDP